MFRSLVPWQNRVAQPFQSIQDEMSNVLRRFFDEDFEPRGEGFHARTNLVETESGYEITTELPGVKAEDLDLQLHDGALILSGKKQEEQEEKGKTFLRVERFSGEFRRVIPFPTAVDEDRVEASYKDGVLRVNVPKAEGAKPKHIAVKSEQN